MIFGLQYALVVGGYAATAFLLGNYMILYTSASEIELGLIFTIQPAVIIVRPLVCSLADRFQSHRAIYLNCALLSFLCHIPFIVIPFLVGETSGTNVINPPIVSERIRFWVLVLSHLIGCICFCCMRTLGDVLTVNYCRRVDESYTKYRKFGPISFGVCSLLLGYVNTRRDLHGLPDYVPGFMLYSSFHLSLFVLFYLWPEDFFVIVSSSQLDRAGSADAGDKIAKDTPLVRPLPDRQETMRHIQRRIARVVTCGAACGGYKSHDAQAETVDRKQQVRGTQDISLDYLNFKQQARIFLLLVKHDGRIPLFLAILVGCGICGHSVQNFVYVYLAKVCRGNSPQGLSCQASSLSGYIMVGICLTETLAYWLASNCLDGRRPRTSESGECDNRLLKIEIGLAVLVAHYLCLAHLVPYSAYFFLAEALHGLEFGLMIATSIEWGDLFANEVPQIIPQLIERRIVSGDSQAQLDLVRVSLIATMMACFLLVYDGLGGVIGGLMYGFMVDKFGFVAAFQLNAILAGSLLGLLLVGSLVAARRPLLRSPDEPSSPAGLPSNSQA